MLLHRCLQSANLLAHRIRPPCSVFGTCGGCQWQHIDYSWSAALEKAQLSENAWSASAACVSVPVLEPFPSPARLQYRSRTNLKVSTSGTPAIGYFQRGTHRVIPVTFCPLLVRPSTRLSHTAITCVQKISTLLTDISEIQLLVSSSNEVLITFCTEILQ